jgi:hypothetical protein
MIIIYFYLMISKPYFLYSQAIPSDDDALYVPFEKNTIRYALLLYADFLSTLDTFPSIANKLYLTCPSFESNKK